MQRPQRREESRKKPPRGLPGTRRSAHRLADAPGAAFWLKLSDQRHLLLSTFVCDQELHSQPWDRPPGCSASSCKRRRSSGILARESATVQLKIPLLPRSPGIEVWTEVARTPDAPSNLTVEWFAPAPECKDFMSSVPARTSSWRTSCMPGRTAYEVHLAFKGNLDRPPQDTDHLKLIDFGLSALGFYTTDRTSRKLPVQLGCRQSVGAEHEDGGMPCAGFQGRAAGAS